ncbi:hypothetical protein KGQ34_01385, partial [Patescibacteria group bacterium]|nr:hypothetical protein [Patescibacteria group bacterium]
MFHFIQLFSQKIVVLVVGAAVAISGLFSHGTVTKVPENPKPEILISNEQKEIVAPKENMQSSETNSVVVPKVVIPPKPVVHKTFTLPSGAIVDEN